MRQLLLFLVLATLLPAAALAELSTPECYANILQAQEQIQDSIPATAQNLLTQTITGCQENMFSNRAQLIIATHHLQAQEFTQAHQQASEVLQKPHNKQLALEATRIALQASYTQGNCAQYTQLHDQYRNEFSADIERERYRTYRNDCDAYLEEQEAINAQEPRDLLITGEQADQTSSVLRNKLVTQGLQPSISSYENTCETCKCTTHLGLRHGFRNTIQLTSQDCISHATPQASATIQLNQPNHHYRVAYTWGVLRGLVPVIESNNPKPSIQGANCYVRAQERPTDKKCLNEQVAFDEEGLMHYHAAYNHYLTTQQLQISQKEKTLLFN